MTEEVGVIGMNGGIGDTSYANNSLPQAIIMAKPITDRAIANLYTSLMNPKTISIADLGCSSGPNTFLIVSNLLKAIDRMPKKLRQQSPEFQIYLNDLPTNDFNTIFRSLPKHQEEFMREMGDGFGQCFFYGVPGSFYGRLFPTDTLHFIHSSYSLHWLSRLPKGIEENKGNICMATGSPPSVIKAYYAQFETDFSTFLKCRSQELVKGGIMVLTIQGRKDEKPSNLMLELLAMALNDLVIELMHGIVEEEKLNSFNVPMYAPSLAEVKYLVEKDGCFTINCLETFQVHWTGNNESDNISNKNNGEYYNVGRYMRAVLEPTLVSHFGEGIFEKVFPRFTNNIAHSMSKENTEYSNVVVSLIKN